MDSSAALRSFCSVGATQAPAHLVSRAVRKAPGGLSLEGAGPLRSRGESGLALARADSSNAIFKEIGMSETARKILLIDDEPNLLFCLTELMKRSGFDVVTANDGQTGLERARREQPDIIVCDVTMPAPDGMALKSMLSRDPATADIPFIFLTARAYPVDKLAGLSQGADDYITKPFHLQELLERVRAVLRRYESGRRKGHAEAMVKADELIAGLAAVAQTDHLTGLHNRHKMDELLREQRALLKRYRGVCSLIIVDLDNFKAVNDTLGHNAGDLVLKEAGDILRANRREADQVGRWGGEEFLIVLPSTSLGNAAISAERLRQELEKRSFPCVERQTASFGVAPLTAEMEIVDCIGRADEALYAAKRNGKNRVCVARY